jgi:hypothetical protein
MLLWDLITAFLNPWVVTPMCVATFFYVLLTCIPVNKTNLVHNLFLVREGADKSLARPERKLATATKLGIYSTYNAA